MYLLIIYLTRCFNCLCYGNRDKKIRKHIFLDVSWHTQFNLYSNFPISCSLLPCQYKFMVGLLRIYIIFTLASHVFPPLLIPQHFCFHDYVERNNLPTIHFASYHRQSMFISFRTKPYFSKRLSRI